MPDEVAHFLVTADLHELIVSGSSGSSSPTCAVNEAHCVWQPFTWLRSAPQKLKAIVVLSQQVSLSPMRHVLVQLHMRYCLTMVLVALLCTDHVVSYDFDVRASQGRRPGA